MAINAQAIVKAHPSTDIPGLIMPFSQPSGAFHALSGSAPEVRIGEEDLFVNVRVADIRTATLSGQTGSNQMPGVDIDLTYKSTPTYLLRNRVEFDHHESNRTSQWNLPIVPAYTLGMEQGFAQLMRNGLLYGQAPSSGEGLLNTNGATTTTLTPDAFGNSTFSTYDNGAMYAFINEQIRQLMAQTYQFGVEQRCVVLGPTRVISRWQTAVVQLTSIQRAGAGSETISSAIQSVMAANKIKVEFAYDDTLIGKGSGGKDAVVITLPDIEVPKMQSVQNTNMFAELQPSITGCNVMYQDVAKPTLKQVNLSMGFVEIMAEIRTTSGWGLRAESVLILSGTY